VILSYNNNNPKEYNEEKMGKRGRKIFHGITIFSLSLSLVVM
jgi:hypothetical protein